MSMSEEFAKRQAAKPDQWTISWINSRFDEVLKGYRGATHAINRSLAEFEDNTRFTEEFRTRCAALEQQAEADRAKIGELQAEIETLKGRLEPIAKFCTCLKKERAAEKKEPADA